jgi:O-antigen/teichoic acid export membrane protein
VTQAFVIGVPLLVTLASPWAMGWFGGERYAESWPVLAIMAGSYVFFGLSQAQLGVLTMLGSGADDLHMDLVAGLLGLAVTAAGALWLGENGMALGQLAAVFATWWAARRAAHVLWRRELAMGP